MGLIILLAVVVVGFLFVIDRKDKRAHDEREAHRKELQIVLNRIQDPTVAVNETTQREPTGAHHLPFEDDSAWAKWQESVA